MFLRWCCQTVAKYFHHSLSQHSNKVATSAMRCIADTILKYKSTSGPIWGRELLSLLGTLVCSGCSCGGSHGMGILSKLSSIYGTKLGRSLLSLSFLCQHFPVFSAWLVSLPTGILWASLPWFAWGGPTSHGPQDLRSGWGWWRWWCVFFTLVITPKGPLSKGGSLHFQAEGGNWGWGLCNSWSVQFCVFTWHLARLASLQQGVGQLFLLPPLMPLLLMTLREGWIKGKASQKKMLNPEVLGFPPSAPHQMISLHNEPLWTARPFISMHRVCLRAPRSFISAVSNF